MVKKLDSSKDCVYKKIRFFSQKKSFSTFYTMDSIKLHHDEYSIYLS